MRVPRHSCAYNLTAVFLKCEIFPERLTRFGVKPDDVTTVFSAGEAYAPGALQFKDPRHFRNYFYMGGGWMLNVHDVETQRETWSI